MVEIVVSTLLIAVVLLAALEVVGSAARGAKLLGRQADASLIAESLMAEILAAAYVDPDANANVTFGVESNEPGSPSNRIAFDDIDDYAGWEESDSIASRDGLQQVAMPGWTRRVRITHIGWDDPSQSKSDSEDQESKHIVVEVIDPSGKSTYAHAIRSASGGMEQPRGVDLTVTSGVAVAMEVNGEVGTAEADLRNHAIGP